MDALVHKKRPTFWLPMLFPEANPAGVGRYCKPMKTQCLKALLRPWMIASILGVCPVFARAQDVPITPPVPTPVVVSILATDAEASEPSGLIADPRVALVAPNVAVFTISRQGATDFDLPVYYDTLGAAQNGVDYVKLPGEVIIPNGQRSVTVTVIPLADGLKEGNEVVGLSLSAPVCPAIFPPPRECYLLGLPAAARAVILDSVVPPLNLLPRVAITQPTSGQSFDAPDSITLEAVAVDADGYAAWVEFFAGKVKIGESQLTFIQAPAPGTSLKHSFEWLNPPAGVHELLAVAHDDRGGVGNSMPVRIQVGPILPPLPDVVTVVAADGEAVEPVILPLGVGAAVRPNTAAFTISRKGPNDFDLPVHFHWEGTAVNGEDFVKLPDVVTIPKGADSVSVVVVPLADNIKEETETVALVLDAPICIEIFPQPRECYQLGDAMAAKAVILDTPPTEVNKPPSVVVTQPVKGQVFDVASGVLFKAETVDSDGYAARVEFYVDQVKVGESSLVFIQAPKPGTVLHHEFEWAKAVPGPHELVAVAYDDAGAATKSAPVPFAVRPVVTLPVVSVVASDPEAVEMRTPLPWERLAPNKGQFKISRTGSLDKELAVFYLLSGDAVNGKDYETLPGRVVIPAGSESAVVDIFAINDQIIEHAETVVLSLDLSVLALPTTGADVILPPILTYEIGIPSAAKVLILDNGEGPVDNSPPKVAVTKPVPGATFTLPASMEIEAQTADADGYVPWVEFFANGRKIGESQLDFLVVPAPGTLITHSFTWKGFAAGDYELTAVAHDNGGAKTATAPGVLVHVRPEAQGTVVWVKTLDAEGAEPDPVAPGMGRPILLNPAVFEISRTGDLSVPVRVNYRLEGTARNGLDYEPLEGHVELPKDVASVRVVITPIDDDLVEGNETVALVIEPAVCLAVAKPLPSCYSILDGHGAAKAVILDNDPNASLRPTVTLSATDPIATEGETDWTSPTATFVITRHGPVEDELVVGLKRGGTALAGKDYEGIPEQVVIPAGKTEVTLTLKAIDDSEVEEIETVLLELLPPVTTGRLELGWPSYRVGQPSKAVAVILDNDVGRPGCRMLPDGHFHVCLPGKEGVRYVLQMSKDLREWWDRGSTDAAQGVVHFVDPESQASDGVRFYRAIPEAVVAP